MDSLESFSKYFQTLKKNYNITDLQEKNIW